MFFSIVAVFHTIMPY